MRLLAVVESLDNGKPIRESRDADVQIVTRHLYHHAGWAQLADTEMSDWKPVGLSTLSDMVYPPPPFWRRGIQLWACDNCDNYIYYTALP